MMSSEQLVAADLLREIRRLDDELATVRAGSALVMQALDCSLQLSDGLMTLLLAWTPQGQVLPPGLAGLKDRLDDAMAKMGSGRIEQAQR